MSKTADAKKAKKKIPTPVKKTAGKSRQQRRAEERARARAASSGEAPTVDNPMTRTIGLEMPAIRGQIILMMIQGLWASGGVRAPLFSREVNQLQADLELQGVRAPELDQETKQLKWGTNLHPLTPAESGAGGAERGQNGSP